MCRALLVLCVAPDGDKLLELKRAAVAAEWELLPGATSADDALAQLAESRPHVLVVVGPFGELVRDARARYPALRIVADRVLTGSDATVGDPGEVRAAIMGMRAPGGPVG